MAEPTKLIYPEVTKIFDDVDPDDPFMIDKPKHGNGGSNIRLKEINRIRSKLDRDGETRKKLSKGYKRFYNMLHSINIGTSGLAATLSGVTIGLVTNPAALLPLAITTATLGAVGTISGVLSKSANTRVKKHQKLSLLANSNLTTVNELLSESLRDSHISDREFKRVLDVYHQYLMECKFTKDAFARRNLVERDQIKKKIDDVLNGK